MCFDMLPDWDEDIHIYVNFYNHVRHLETFRASQ